MTTRRLAQRTRTLRWALTLLVAAIFVAVAAAGLLQVCADAVAGTEVVRTCRPPQVGDGATLALALFVGLLLAPDVSEVGIGGLLTLRSRLDRHERELAGLGLRVESVQSQVALTSSSAVGGAAFVQVVSGVQTGRYASARAAAPAGSVDQARYLAADLLLSHLGDLGAALLDGANLRLYLPSGDGSVLEPVLEPALEAVPTSVPEAVPTAVPGSRPAPAQRELRAGGDAWRAGEGVVGRAWSTGEIVVARGPEVQSGLAGLPPARRERYRLLAIVVALPVVNAAGDAIGVLSASSRDPGSGLDGDDALDELLAASQLIARALVDLLGWAEDTSGPPTMVTEHLSPSHRQDTPPGHRREATPDAQHWTTTVREDHHE
jgi:hypothetical protein